MDEAYQKSQFHISFNKSLVWVTTQQYFSQDVKLLKSHLRERSLCCQIKYNKGRQVREPTLGLRSVCVCRLSGLQIHKLHSKPDQCGNLHQGQSPESVSEAGLKRKKKKGNLGTEKNNVISSDAQSRTSQYNLNKVLQMLLAKLENSDGTVSNCFLHLLQVSCCTHCGNCIFTRLDPSLGICNKSLQYAMQAPSC